MSDKILTKHETKVIHFLSALQDCYKDEDDRESSVLTKLDLSSEEITDDMVAIIESFLFFYKKVTADKDMDLVGFTHLINRLVVQTIIERKDE